MLYFWHSVGNRVLTLMSNVFTNLNLTDMETCYKVFRREVIQEITIEEDRFGFEPEITAKIAARRLPHLRSRHLLLGSHLREGKKIGWNDGVRAIWCIVKYRPRRVSSAAATTGQPGLDSREAGEQLGAASGGRTRQP